MRRRRADANEKEIVAAFRKCGATVEHLISDNRPGVPDLLVGIDGKNHLVEIKMPKTGRLSTPQKTWRDSWKGGKPFVVKTILDVEMFMYMTWRKV